MSNQQEESNDLVSTILKIWTYKFITLDCGDFILRYNNPTLKAIIFEITLQFSVSFNLFEEFERNNEEIHKINEKNGCGQ